MKTLKVAVSTLPILVSCASTTNISSSAQHEYAHIKKLDIRYANWDFPLLDTQETLYFQPNTTNNKLILLVYFSAWCPNFRNEIDTLLRLSKTHPELEVIGIGEYASYEETKALIDEWQIPFKVVMESDSRDARTHTTHYEYRQKAGDTRKWGSPWHLLIDTSTNETWVVNGELIESEITEFLVQRTR